MFPAQANILAQISLLTCSTIQSVLEQRIGSCRHLSRSDKRRTVDIRLKLSGVVMSLKSSLNKRPMKDSNQSTGRMEINCQASTLQKICKLSPRLPADQFDGVMLEIWLHIHFKDP